MCDKVSVCMFMGVCMYCLYVHVCMCTSVFVCVNAYKHSQMTVNVLMERSNDDQVFDLIVTVKGLCLFSSSGQEMPLFVSHH